MAWAASPQARRSLCGYILSRSVRLFEVFAPVARVTAVLDLSKRRRFKQAMSPADFDPLHNSKAI
jgi:hypothetical protein